MQRSFAPTASLKTPEAPFTLEGKTAIVTGSGRGIGRAIARRLVSAGACVMLNDLDERMLQESRESLPDPERVDVVAGDLTDPDGRKIDSRLANRPVVAPNDADAIAKMLERQISS